MARGDFPSAKQDQFMVRFPDGMREKIKEAADDRGRSMNAEIIQRLQLTLPNGDNQKCVVELGKILWTNLIVQAQANETTPEKLVAGIVEDAIRGETEDFSYPLKDAYELSSYDHSLRMRIDALEEAAENDFILYYHKVIHMMQFAEIILSSVGEAIPDGVLKQAKQMRELADAEIEIAKRRYIDEIINFRKKNTVDNDQK